ncbi:hypothetical protein FQZ97_1012540 [compost metagenome]
MGARESAEAGAVAAACSVSVAAAAGGFAWAVASAAALSRAAFGAGVVSGEKAARRALISNCVTVSIAWRATLCRSVSRPLGRGSGLMAPNRSASTWPSNPESRSAPRISRARSAVRMRSMGRAVSRRVTRYVLPPSHGPNGPWMAGIHSRPSLSR